MSNRRDFLTKTSIGALGAFACVETAQANVVNSPEKNIDFETDKKLLDACCFFGYKGIKYQIITDELIVLYHLGYDGHKLIDLCNEFHRDYYEDIQFVIMTDGSSVEVDVENKRLIICAENNEQLNLSLLYDEFGRYAEAWKWDLVFRTMDRTSSLGMPIETIITKQSI